MIEALMVVEGLPVVAEEARRRGLSDHRRLGMR